MPLFQPGDQVLFDINATTRNVPATVRRGDWGIKAVNVTLRTRDNRTFVRLASEVYALSPETTSEGAEPEGNSA